VGQPVVVAIVGPTGVGKSDLGIGAAQALRQAGIPAEIVNADAMQLYAGLDIGTAKVPEANRGGVVHHLFDVWPVSKEASVADYQTLARRVITECCERGVVPILVGGSGLYVSSVLYDFEFPGTDPDIRQALEQRLQDEGVDQLAAELAQLDPEAGAAIDPRNSRRIVRALEVIQLTGKPFGAGLHARSTLWIPATRVVGVRRERASLNQGLEKRVEQMWDSGLVDEARALVASGEAIGVTASQAIGYRQVFGFLEGAMTREEAIAETVTLTKRYARRQMSWFRRDPQVTWHDVDDPLAPGVIIRDLVDWVSGHLPVGGLPARSPAGELNTRTRGVVGDTGNGHTA
jgi:tRNA dimethylallyltransferase